MKEKILLADDEKELARAEEMILSYSNYDVDVVYNGEEAVEEARKNIYDVIILDVMMPVKDGITALKEIRETNDKTPILLLTAKSQIYDKVEGLDSGADDYLTKPFNKEELLARIRALIRKSNAKKEKYNIGNLTFDKENSEIASDKAVLHLNNKECEIMEVLVKNQEKDISKTELKDTIWNKEVNDESIVPMYISYLQEKFSALGANVKIRDNNGYMLEKIYD